MVFAQTSSDSTPAAKTETTTTTPPKSSEKKSKAGTTPAIKSDAGDNQALKKKWCVENVEATFMNADGAPRTPLQQFTEFVNQICPQLEAEVPSK